MIVKEKDFKAAKAPTAEAGEQAERQMAYYLRGAFGDDPVVAVLNDLRFELESSAVQIDHLVVHRWGMVIVESKSVSEAVAVNERGEWSRVRGAKRTGMSSPIEQARRQAAGLRKLLQAEREALLDQRFQGVVQRGFEGCPIDVLVAISDKGMIERQGFEASEVVKADQVAGRIAEVIERRRRASAILCAREAGDEGLWEITSAELTRITEFLRARHTPLRSPRGGAATEAAAARALGASSRRDDAGAGEAAEETVALEALACEKCKSTDVRIVHARYGYCLKCAACGGYTAIDPACPSCGKRARIAKSGPEFRRVCSAEGKAGGCGAEVVFFRNPDGSDAP